jgi:DNA replication and repair protein RecF
MMHIIEGGPEERRHYINLALSQAQPGYAQALNEYHQALTQRNALLKLLAERGGDSDQLIYWDDVVSSRGAFIIQARILAIQQLERQVRKIHQSLTHSREVLRLVYQPAYDPIQPPMGQISLPIDVALDRSRVSLEEIQKGFSRRLIELRGTEIARGLTTIGPHRDELRFISNSVDLGEFGSRGQARTALLALKLAEVGWLKQRTGDWPVLLLDEILAELDHQRRTDLLSALEECEQGLLTTTDISLFDPVFIQNCVLWRMREGSISHDTPGETSQ